ALHRFRQLAEARVFGFDHSRDSSRIRSPSRARRMQWKDNAKEKPDETTLQPELAGVRGGADTGKPCDRSAPGCGTPTCPCHVRRRLLLVHGAPVRPA